MTHEFVTWLPERKHWGLLLFAVFIGYLFVEPYQRGAGALEWTLTGLGVECVSEDNSPRSATSEG